MKTKPMVVILSAFLTPFRSGAEACAEEVAAELQENFDITIVTSRLRSDLPRRTHLRSGVPVIRVGFGSSLDKWLFPFFAPFAARKLRPQIIHAILESYAGAALVGCRFVCPGVQRILTLQSTNTSWFLRLMQGSAHRITAISSVLVKRAKKLGRHDVTLIPNGMHFEDIRSECMKTPKVRGRALFVGRLEEVKGVDTLLEAFKQLHHFSPPDLPKKSLPQLRIVGDGSQRTHLRTLMGSFGLSDQVTFTGRLTGPALLQEYAEAEIFCGLSRSEALGNVFLEAQAAGCAVIATHVGGIPDIVEDGKTGILIPPDSPPAATNALKRLLTDEGLRERLGKAGIANAKKYDWSLIAKQYADVYEEMLEKGGRRK